MPRPLVSLSLLLLMATAVRAEDRHWNQFRGPEADGISAATNLPLEWSEESDTVKWKTAIPGKGWSSPVIWNDQIWITTADPDGKTMSAMCLDRETGEVIHDVLVFENEKTWYCHPTNSYASCTPFVEEGRIYVHFGRYGTACLDTTSGKILWKRRGFESDDFRGPASSPIIDGDRLFVAFDGIDLQFVVCLDKRTGDTLWQRDRDIDYDNDNPDFHKAYSTAKVVEIDGQKQLISPAAVETIAYEPETGQTLWRFRHGGMNAACPPQLRGQTMYLTAGDLGGGLFAIRPGGSGDISDSNLVWNHKKAVSSRSGPIIVNGLLFMVNDAGVVTCLDAATGESVWQKRIGGSYWSSPVYADGRIYFSNKEGLTTVVEASRDFKQLAKNKLDAGINASPAVAGDSLFVRTFTHLYCLEQPGS